MKMSMIALGLFMLLDSSLIGAQAKGKQKVEVINFFTYFSFETELRTVPAAPHQTITKCNGSSGIYNSEYGSTCTTIDHPAAPEYTVRWPSAIGYYHGLLIKLPDETQSLYWCNSGHDKRCAAFSDPKSGGIEEGCKDLSEGTSGAIKNLCVYTRNGQSTLGMYDATIEDDKITISGPKGKRVYSALGPFSEEPDLQASTEPSQPVIESEQTQKETLDPKGSGISLGPNEQSGNLDGNSQGIKELKDRAGRLYKQADYSQAIPLLSEACLLGDGDSCGVLGTSYFSGLGVALDYSESMSLYSRGCGLGSSLSCLYLGNIYKEGRVVPQDNVKALKIFSNACDIGNARGCLMYGVMVGAGEGIARDVDRALSFYAKSCNGGEAEGCSLLGEAYARGIGTKQNREIALEYLKKGCSMGDKRGCTWLNELP